MTYLFSNGLPTIYFPDLILTSVTNPQSCNSLKKLLTVLAIWLWFGGMGLIQIVLSSFSLTNRSTYWKSSTKHLTSYVFCASAILWYSLRKLAFKKISVRWAPVLGKTSFSNRYEKPSSLMKLARTPSWVIFELGLAEMPSTIALSPVYRILLWPISRNSKEQFFLRHSPIALAPLTSQIFL